MATVFPYPHNKDEQEKLQKILDNLLDKRISLDSNIEEPDPLISLKDAPILYRGSLCFISGQAGSRKTSGLVLLCADMICHEKIIDSPFTIPNSLNILYIDTEQIKFDTQRIVKRVSHYAGYQLTQQKLFVYPLLEYSIELNPCLVEFLIVYHRPDIVIIDNISHMGEGVIMDLKVAELLLRNLRQVAEKYNIAIIGVLHTNEGSSINSPRGHGGSEAVREADLVLMFSDVPEENYSKVSTIKARRKKPEYWGVSIDNNGIPYYLEILQTNKTTQFKRYNNSLKHIDYTKYFNLIPITGIKYNDLARRIDEMDGREIKKNKPSKTAERRINDMKSMNLIYDRNGLYFRKDDFEGTY